MNVTEFGNRNWKLSVRIGSSFQWHEVWGMKKKH